MLHSNKSQAIVQWYNSLTTKGDVNSLEQFADGSHFYEIVANLQPFLLQESKEDNLTEESVIFSETGIACNEEVITSVEEEAAGEKVETAVSESMNADPFVIKESDHTDTHKKYDVIKKFIDDFYHLESSSLIDYGECQNGKEMELAKVAVFLLSAFVQNLVSSKDEVLYNTTLLDIDVQNNIYECLSLVIGEKETGENQIKKSELQRVLSRAISHKGTTLRKQPSRSTPDPNELSEGVKNVPKKKKERTSFVSDNPQDSPLKTLYESPKIQQKADIFRKQSELAKLRSALHNEEDKVMNLTLEKKNLNEELGRKKKELVFYKKELESLREALGEKEEQEKLRAEELKAKKIEAENLRKLIESQEEEIKQLKGNNDVLQEKVVNLEKKQEQVTTSLSQENKKLKANILELMLDKERKDLELEKLNKEFSICVADCDKYREKLPGNSVSKERDEKRRETGSPLGKIIYASCGTSERKEQELWQDLDIKDERIERLEPKQCKGETSKNSNSTAESEKIVNDLTDNVRSLETENKLLKKKLEFFESKFGVRTVASPSGDLNSIKIESDRIGLATGNVSESSHFSKSDCKMEGQSTNIALDAVRLAELKFKFDWILLKSIIKELEKKNCIAPNRSKQLIKDCTELQDLVEFSARLQDLYNELRPSKGSSVVTRSSRKNSLEIIENSDKENPELTPSQKKTIEDLKVSNANLLLEVENLRKEVTIAQEKYIHMEKLAKKKDEDVKKALIMYQRIVKLDKKDKDSKKECGEECEKLRKRCKILNQECIDFEQLTGELKRAIENLKGMMEHLRFEIKELKKEKKELQQKLWEETSALSKNTTDRDALVLHYLKKSKHQPKKNKNQELKKEEQKKTSRPIVKVDAYILNSENEPSVSNSVLASRSIRSSFFQVADEDDFLNESSLAEIHNGGITEGEYGEYRLLELQRRNTLCPPHLQSSYPLEIQNMTPSEKKYYNPEEVSFDLGRKSSLFSGEREIRKKPKSKYMESDSDDSDVLDDSHSFPVKKRKISETERISVPVSVKHCRPSCSVAKRSSKDQENPRSTPLKRVAAFVRKQSSSFKTPSSVHRLMRLPRKTKIH